MKYMEKKNIIKIKSFFYWGDYLKNQTTFINLRVLIEPCSVNRRDLGETTPIAYFITG